jgi:chromosome segregation ATPase
VLKRKVKAMKDEMEVLEKVHGEADLEEFDAPYEDGIDHLGSEEFVEEEAQPKEDTSQKASAEEKPEWDAERQRADQAEANFRKAQTQLEEANAKLERQDKSIETLTQRLDKYAEAHDVNLDEIDTDIVDPNVVKALKGMKAQIDAANARAETLEKARDDISQKLENDNRAAAREAEKAEIIAAVEEDYPSKFRNRAIEMANDICTKRGYAPRSATESLRILRSCYKKLAGETKTEKTEDVATDTGAGSTSVVSEAPKETTMKDAVSEWRKKLRRKR